jgi:hypothetical protein
VQVGMNAHVVHRDKRVFGEDADLFNPERWLESEARNKEMEKYLLTFGAGSRTCVGKNISLMVKLIKPHASYNPSTSLLDCSYIKSTPFLSVFIAPHFFFLRLVDISTELTAGNQ